MKQNENEKYNKSLWDVFKNYNRKKWTPPKTNNLTIPFIWAMYGLLKPHNKNKNNQNGGFNNYKNY